MCKGHSVGGYYDTLANRAGLLSAQVKVEGIVMKAAWH